jgi:hypothetical protein
VKTREFAVLSDLRSLEDEIRIASEGAMSAIQGLVQQGDPLALLEAVKFDKMGWDPMEPTRSLNFIEQVNQTFTALVSVRAVEYLFEHHPEAAPFRVNLGTAPGSGVESLDGSVAGEVFAATHPGSNGKLKKDIAEVAAVSAQHRYVFFHCPGDHATDVRDGVRVIPLALGVGR